MTQCNSQKAERKLGSASCSLRLNTLIEPNYVISCYIIVHSCLYYYKILKNTEKVPREPEQSYSGATQKKKSVDRNLFLHQSPHVVLDFAQFVI